jgi:hypothetical protein
MSAHAGALLRLVLAMDASGSAVRGAEPAATEASAITFYCDVELPRVWICDWVRATRKIISSSSWPTSALVPSTPSQVLTPARIGVLFKISALVAVVLVA